jgi:hypothetical protein
VIAALDRRAHGETHHRAARVDGPHHFARADRLERADLAAPGVAMTHVALHAHRLARPQPAVADAELREDEREPFH